MRGVVVVGLLALAIAAAGVAAANERPMAEAGLDQDSTVNSTVYLDAGGSLDPDGDIVSYDWAIERPNGTTTVPDCETCSLTHFVPMRPGQYNVTVTVTDEDGASMNDTMYVTVEGLFIPPSAPSPGGGSGGAWGGGGWGGGGNDDSVTYNYQSGNLWIDLAEGSNNVQLPGADRDPQEAGANFNAWITDEEIDDLVRSNHAERHDSRIEVKGRPAEKLYSTLDPSHAMEHKYTPAKTILRANQTADEVLDLGTDADPEDIDSGNTDESSGNSDSQDSSYSPPDQRSEGADRNIDDSAESTSSNSDSNTDIDDSHSYEFGPEGCTMGAFC